MPSRLNDRPLADQHQVRLKNLTDRLKMRASLALKGLPVYIFIQPVWAGRISMANPGHLAILKQHVGDYMKG
jgi:hypothetical protein